MIKNMSNLGTILNKSEQKSINGGLSEASGRRCDRLLRRAERYLDNGNLRGYDRVMATFSRVCPIA
ncbi:MULTISPECIES: hypothetical protein [unclassified Tenacibaculum]|uniref:hypothetical protein n=1 Tax=unclassified Tenacibaculum TaxID=2635139 RepID=UPI001F3AA1F9|nr:MULTISPECIES: hypothetical protein [unclassified Tenacibaculum]MCF2873353.1 hypothetical protein [Tenacibaculum sp. Cn5-1]MCF2933509.1 hypothetical protein [Tenacibaculum sp. Cn5-34]MCG7509909.1 hypothetical protein [Tenacibaculum sp. Cn5-46]